MQTRTRYGLLLMLIAALLYAGAAVAHCQELSEPLIVSEIEHPTHATKKDFLDSLRIFEIEILYYDPVSKTIDWKFEEGALIEVGQFQITTTTTIRGKIKKGARRLIVYCAASHGTGLNERIKYLVLIEE